MTERTEEPSPRLGCMRVMAQRFAFIDNDLPAAREAERRPNP
jgi:hypothetical protein